MIRTITAAVAILAATGAQAQILRVGGADVRISQKGDATMVNVREGGRTSSAVLPVEEGITAHALQRSRIIAADGDVLILASEYTSRPGNPDAECGAGTETVLRVIALRPSVRQAYHQTLESCWTNVDEGRAAWDHGSRELTIVRTVARDSTVQTETTVLRIGTDGETAALPR